MTYRVSDLLEPLVELPRIWRDTPADWQLLYATYCQSRIGNHLKSTSTQPMSEDKTPLLRRHLQRKTDLPVDNCRVIPRVQSLLLSSSFWAFSRTNNLLAPKIGPLNFSASAHHFTVPCLGPFKVEFGLHQHFTPLVRRIRWEKGSHFFVPCAGIPHSWHWTGSLHWLLDWASVCSRSHDQRTEGGLWDMGLYRMLIIVRLCLIVFL